MSGSVVLVEGVVTGSPDVTVTFGAVTVTARAHFNTEHFKQKVRIETVKTARDEGEAIVDFCT
jgi:hypothetical protein